MPAVMPEAQATYVLDDVADTRLANSAPWEREVMHVFTSSYLGIRAAAAALPGYKLSVAAVEDLPDGGEEVLRLIASVNPSRIVVHGMSPALGTIARLLSRMRPAAKIYGVFHGNLAQWSFPPERSEAARFLELDKTDIFHRAHFLKPGVDVLLKHPSECLLINAAPRISESRAPRWDATVFVPATDNIRKNLYGNLVAAELSPSTKAVWHYADVPDSPVPLTKGRRVLYAGPADHSLNLAAATLILNATAIDCHPMVDLEANAAGRLSLHGDYRLQLPPHEAEALQTVPDVHNVDRLIAQVEETLAIPWQQRAAMATDYARLVTIEALARYQAFLEL